MGAGEARARVYVILGSHACRTGTLMLEHKGIPFETEIMPTGSQRILPLLRFPGGTVPALVMDGQRVQTNPAIARFLDEVEPDPPLFPPDPALRREVEEAERWGDDIFQMAARRITLAGILHGPGTYVAGAGAGRLGPILWRRRRARAIGVRGVCRIFDVNPRTEPGLLEELPGLLDRVDGWIGAGVLNGEQLNAADYMIATSLALILYRRDVGPQVEGRRAMTLVDRVLPDPWQRGSSPASRSPVAAVSAA